MMAAPSVVLLDVNETLSDTGALGEVFESVGLPAASAPTWFAQVLRDGFALTVTRDNVAFRDIAASLLPELPAEHVERVLAAFAQLPLHPDVVPALTRLAGEGHRVVCLSNGAAAVAEELLERNGLSEQVERCLSVADAPSWKPDARSYAWAAERCGVPLADLLLVAVHPWDVHGAATAGAQTAWVNRTGAAYPRHFRAPDVIVGSLQELLVGDQGIEQP